jgi:O-antigen ligase
VITGIKDSNYPFFILGIVFIAFAVVAFSSPFYYLAGIPFAVSLFYAGWKWPTMVFLLLLFSLPFSTEIMVTDTLGTDMPDELLMVFTGFLFLCYLAYKPIVLNKAGRNHPLIMLLLLGFGWAAFSTIFSTQPLLSLKFLLAKSWYLAAFVLAPLIVFRDKQMIRKSVAILVTGIVLVTIIAMVRHSQYGYTFAEINKALQPFFRNHVNYSAMLVCAIPIVFIYRRTLPPGKKRVMISVLLIVLLTALFLSYARGAWLALLTGATAAWLIKKRALVTAYIVVIVVSVAALFWVKDDDRYLDYAHNYQTTVWHKDFRDHLVATYQLKDVSTAERFYRWIAGLRMVRDNWLAGYGPNSFYHNYKPYTIPAFRTWVSSNDERSTVHNYYLLLFIEQGIPGLLLFLLLAGAMLYYVQSLYYRITDDFYKKMVMATGIIIIMILTVNFLSDMIETDKIGSLFFLCLSGLVVADVNTRHTG